MNRFQYYQEMKGLARQVRAAHRLETPRVLRSDLRRIYREYQIRIDPWPYKLKHLRGAYFHDQIGTAVMIADHLPPEPRIFTLAHELKHHLVDRDLSLAYCSASNESEQVEIGAEVFAAELIFPESDFAERLVKMGVGKGKCEPVHLIRLKNESRTTLSYAGLAKRAEFLEFAQSGSLDGIRWKKLEVQILGEPVYKRIQRYRAGNRG